MAPRVCVAASQPTCGGCAAGEAPARFGAQFTLSTVSMKLNVLVSTQSADTVSTLIVPMRSVLLVTARPRVDGLMSRPTAMPRRGSYRKVSTETSAVPPVERGVRSEEHTSELQSLAYLVCRLLLEKKK